MRLHLFLGLTIYFVVKSGFAAEQIGPDIQRRQTIQLEQNQLRHKTDVDILDTDTGRKDISRVIVEETPCFTLTALEWQGAEAFPWLIEEGARFIGECIGATSLANIRNHLVLALIARGYVTSRVVYPKQNLATGTLHIELIPGRIGKIESSGEYIGLKWFPLATHVGNLLNQRDLDQTLENFRRLPSHAQTRFELIPGENLGESNLRLLLGRSGRIHGNFALDDAGSKSTGQYQLSGSLVLDSPLGLYDSLSITYNTNANTRNSTLGNRASGVQWNVPLGYASVFLGANQSNYKQTVAGFNAPIAYTGTSRAYEAGLGLTSYRSGNHKGQSQLKVFRKVSRNHIDDAEISVQARDIIGAELAHTHKLFVGDWTLAATATVRASLPSHSKNVGVIVGITEWDGHYRLGIFNFVAARGFNSAGHTWRYQTQLRWQHSTTPLPPTEYVSIGGRYSVRGFDGEQTLSSESGGYWRNELGLSVSASALPGSHETYLALDAGRIAGAQSAGLAHRNLIGTAIGLRGNIGHASYDLSLGWPLDKPDTLTTRRPAVAIYFGFDFNT